MSGSFGSVRFNACNAFFLFLPKITISIVHIFLKRLLLLDACLASHPSDMLVCLSEGSAQTIIRAATLRQKLQIKLAILTSHSIVTTGLPSQVATL